ncbi:DNA methyltransferase [Cellulosimicrobium sp. JZ28]|uniref:DNA methyltransferase n=1 Tax=Cellulosimicrobium sp. JZ28 TaxID=1906273 RepID=UPI00188B316D|nr:DNA methyltransferase [Cellulosimicrobium sp. JZ28]
MANQPANAHAACGSEVKPDPRLPRWSLLDAGLLPVRELSVFAQREARRPRPIYGAHKWFARRLGTAFRSLLVAAATDADGDFWDGYYGSANLRGITVLDTFVGGGTALVEAQRLGATVIGLDVDPVAAAVTRFELDAADQPDPEQILRSLQSNVAGKLARYHQVADAPSVEGPHETVVHHFWVQAVECRGCDETIHAHPTWQIAIDQPPSRSRGEDGSRRRQYVLCRHCNAILERPGDRSRVRCGQCNRTTVIAQGTVVNGTVTCPRCATTERLIDVAERTKKPPSWHLFALEVVAAGGARRHRMSQRHFRVATDADRALVDAAAAVLAEREKDRKAFIPTTEIPTDRVDDRLIRYGYRRYRDLFNPRQLLHLSLLAEAILELPEEQRGVAALAFSNHLTTTCMLTSYAAGWRRLVPLFSIRAYRHVPRPVEVNPWLDGTGRGTFPNAMRQVAAAIAYAKDPRELTGNGFAQVPALAPERQARVLCQSSEDLSAIETGSVSLLLSDPPYLDNIAYSELSDFFAPWLRMLKVTTGTPAGQARATNLAAGDRSADAAAVFARRLGTCFRQAERVLADDGRVVFTYQHATATGWHSLAQALATAALVPVNVVPLRGDGGFGLHAHAGSSIFDAILILRPRVQERRIRAFDDDGPLPTLTLSPQGEKQARAATEKWSSELAAQMPELFRRPDRINLLRAHLVVAALAEHQARAAATGPRNGDGGRALLDALNDTTATASVDPFVQQGA